MSQESQCPLCGAFQNMRWSPYLVGCGIGVLCWIAFGIAKDPLGVTTAFSRIASLAVLPFIGAEGVAQNSYWKPMPLRLDYGVVFLFGLMLGAFFSALSSKRLRIELLPSRWSERFGNSKGRRFAAAFLGGAILMFGARMAGGCTSGHGVSGTLQLAVSSWTFVIVAFLTGIVLAHFLFDRNRGVS